MCVRGIEFAFFWYFNVQLFRQCNGKRVGGWALENPRVRTLPKFVRTITEAEATSIP
jgi:hypothetical protein